ncbi:hypothetical protein [Streptosporangium sp. NPDC051022]|uniref:hypothetical protein n=1 Tax=Streptosporangium sp. NPDC051022 TaxID=3155752 RepID=UPI00343A7499
MSDSPITPRMPRNMLGLLVPDGSSLDLAWAVLVGDREQVGTHNGRPVYSPTITSWHFVQACSGQADAEYFAKDMGVASLGGVEVDQWAWHFLPGDQGLELYASDGDEKPTDVAIVPLTALLADEPAPTATPSVRGGPPLDDATEDEYRREQDDHRIPRESA